MICALDPGLRGLGSNAGRGIFFFFFRERVHSQNNCELSGEPSVYLKRVIGNFFVCVSFLKCSSA